MLSTTYTFAPHPARAYKLPLGAQRGKCLPKSHAKGASITVAFSRDLYDHIVHYPQNEPSQGYVSVSEFVKDSARRRLEELERRLDDRKPEVDHAAARIRAATAPLRGKFCASCGADLRGPFCSRCGAKAP